MVNARYGGSLSANSLQTQKPKDLFRIVFKYYVDYANLTSNHRETPDQDLFVSSLSLLSFLLSTKFSDLEDWRQKSCLPCARKQSTLTTALLEIPGWKVDHCDLELTTIVGIDNGVTSRAGAFTSHQIAINLM